MERFIWVQALRRGAVYYGREGLGPGHSDGWSHCTCHRKQRSDMKWKQTLISVPPAWFHTREVPQPFKISATCCRPDIQTHVPMEDIP